MVTAADIGIGILDKFILCVALLVVGLNVQSLDNPVSVAFDTTQVFLTVVIAYFAVWLFVRFLLLPMRGMEASTWLRIALAILAAVFTLWAFPLVLSIAFLLVGLELAVDVETILTWTFALRFFLKMWLHRRFADE